MKRADQAWRTRRPVAPGIRVKAHPATLLTVVISAIACIAVGFLPRIDMPVAVEAIYSSLPGLLFGVIVLTTRAARTTASILLVALSGAIYWWASDAAADLYAHWKWPAAAACAVVGGVAALALSLGLRGLRRVRPPRFADPAATLAGSAGGLLIGLAFTFGETRFLRFQLLLFLGYLVWQLGVAVAHQLIPWWWPLSDRAAVVDSP